MYKKINRQSDLNYDQSDCQVSARQARRDQQIGEHVSWGLVLGWGTEARTQTLLLEGTEALSNSRLFLSFPFSR